MTTKPVLRKHGGPRKSQASTHEQWPPAQRGLAVLPEFLNVKTASPEALRAVLKAGDGRGFAVDGREGRLIITAGHCLPSLPPCCTFEEATYQSLLGPLDVAEPTVWAKCLFVDPIADLAVFGAPGNQTLNDRYKALTGAMTPLRIARADEDTTAFILSLDQQWLACHVSDAPRRAVDHWSQVGPRHVGLADHRHRWPGDWRRLYRHFQRGGRVRRWTARPAHALLTALGATAAWF